MGFGRKLALHAMSPSSNDPNGESWDRKSCGETGFVSTGAKHQSFVFVSEGGKLSVEMGDCHSFIKKSAWR